MKSRLEQALAEPIPFGKYRGRALGDVAMEDIGYTGWLTTLRDLREPFRTAVLIVSDEYSADIDAAMDLREDSSHRASMKEVPTMKDIPF